MSDVFINKVILCGQVIATPELRRTKKGTPVTNFLLKTIEPWDVESDKSTTKIHKLVCWMGNAVKACNTLSKNDFILVYGDICYQKYIQKINTSDGDISVQMINTEIKVNTFDIIPSNQEN